MTKEELKDRISMALKDPVLQQGFEIICKENAELEKENAELKEKLNFSTQYYQGEKAKEQLSEAKKIIENIIRVTWGEGWNYSLDWKVKAEQFLNSEVEK